MRALDTPEEWQRLEAPQQSLSPRPGGRRIKCCLDHSALGGALPVPALLMESGGVVELLPECSMGGLPRSCLVLHYSGPCCEHRGNFRDLGAILPFTDSSPRD